MSLNGWIIYNGNLPGKVFLDYAEWMQKAAFLKNINTTIYQNNELLVYLTSNSLDLVTESIEKKLPDFVIFTDKDIYLAKHLELLGVRVFNSARSIEISDDKIATYHILAEKKLRIPKTIIAPKLFGMTPNLDISFTKYVVDKLGFPMIIKEAYGSFGEQVYLIKSKKEMNDKVHQLIGKPFVFQEFIASSFGKDLRLHVVGNQVVASMIRKSKNDFRANVSAGGTMESYNPTLEEEKLAINATKAIGADFAGVDLLFGPDNKPIICEVNSNAHIRNLYDCTKINVADFMIDHIVNILKDK